MNHLLSPSITFWSIKKVGDLFTLLLFFFPLLSSSYCSPSYFTWKILVKHLCVIWKKSPLSVLTSLLVFFVFSKHISAPPVFLPVRACEWVFRCWHHWICYEVTNLCSGSVLPCAFLLSCILSFISFYTSHDQITGLSHLTQQEGPMKELDLYKNLFFHFLLILMVKMSSNEGLLEKCTYTQSSHCMWEALACLKAQLKSMRKSLFSSV